MHTGSKNKGNQTRKGCLNFVCWKTPFSGKAVYSQQEHGGSVGCGLSDVHPLGLHLPSSEKTVSQLYHHGLFTEVSLLRSQQPARGCGLDHSLLTGCSLPRARGSSLKCPGSTAKGRTPALSSPGDDLKLHSAGSPSSDACALTILL